MRILYIGILDFISQDWVIINSLKLWIFSLIQYGFFPSRFFQFHNVLYLVIFNGFIERSHAEIPSFLKEMVFLQNWVEKNGIFTTLSGKEWYFHSQGERGLTSSLRRWKCPICVYKLNLGLSSVDILVKVANIQRWLID